MTEKEFHAARRMFAVNAGTVLVAPPGHPYSHVEWLSSLLGFAAAEQWVRRFVRGYVLGDRLVAYVGEDFSHRVPVSDVMAALDLFDRLDPGAIKTVGVGAVSGPTQPWEPRDTMPAEAFFALKLRNLPTRTEVGTPEEKRGG